jgi:hypothetical protein
MGKSISIENAHADSLQWRTVVGIVGNVRNWPGATHDDPQVYEPYSVPLLTGSFLTGEKRIMNS